MLKFGLDHRTGENLSAAQQKLLGAMLVDIAAVEAAKAGDSEAILTIYREHRPDVPEDKARVMAETLATAAAVLEVDGSVWIRPTASQLEVNHG